MALPNKQIKDTTIKESMVKNTLVLNIVLSIVGILLYFLYLSPQLADVSAQKDALAGEVTKYNTLKKSGFTLDELKTLSTADGGQSIFADIDQTFYSTNLENKTFPTYDEFLNDREKYLKELATNNTLALRDASLASVLPQYIEGGSMTGSVMSDFDFVNYLERLIYSFDLETTSSIGIGSLTAVDMTEVLKENKMSAQIYSIGLDLSLKGRKADLMNFLYFLQNVGDVQSVSEEGIEFYKDKNLKTIIVGDKGGPSYNIYENKIANIDKITFSKYIDGTSTIRPKNRKSTLGFLNYITEGKEKDEAFEITTTLNFYVRGLPVYKVKNDVDTVLARYKEIHTKVSQAVSKIKTMNNNSFTADQLKVVRNMNTLDSFINEMSKSIVELEQSKKGEADYQIIYKLSSKTSQDLDNVENAYNKIDLTSLNLNP